MKSPLIIFLTHSIFQLKYLEMKAIFLTNSPTKSKQLKIREQQSFNSLNQLYKQKITTLMTLHRTDSITLNQRMEEIKMEQASSHSINSNTRNRQRVPQFLQATLRGIMLESMASGNLVGVGMKQSKVGQALKSRFKGAVDVLKSTTKCQICESDIKKPKNKNLEVYMCNCEHKFNFCESCLHHYVIYKVKNFEQVMCPRDGCPASLDMSTNFFKNLPADIQKNYKKIYQFYLTSKDPNIRLCPRQNCEGIIKKIDDNVMVCNECQKQFCSKCLLSIHQGLCDTEEVKFFEGNLHYRQCKKCKMVIEKNQGCNHMTCRCKHQFCYVCGEDWNTSHYGPHDQNGRVMAVPDPGAGNNLVHYQDPDCCGCECCGCCEGCECCGCCGGCECCGCCERCECCDLQETCGSACAAIIKAPLKLFLILLFLCLMSLIVIGRDFFVIFSVLFMSILAGMFGYSIQILSNLDCVMCVLGVIFFPVTMGAGIVLAIREMLCEVITDLCKDTCRMLCDGLQSICDI